MLNRKLGKNGPAVPAIGFGGMRFDHIENQAECVELLQYAYAKGIRYFDTAPGYCQDQSEIRFGQGLQGLKDIVISTKCSDPQGAKVRETLEKSLTQLKRDKVSVFHIWYVLTMQAYEERLRGGAVEEALKMKAEGRFDHLYISTHLEGDDVIKILSSGIYDGVTLGYSPLNFKFRQAAIRYAREHGLAVVAMNPLAGGQIPKHPEKFSFLHRTGDRSLVESSLRFDLTEPGISVALVGMGNKAHVDEAWAAIDATYAPWTPAEVASVEKTEGGRFAGLCTGCGYCEGCPEDIEIPKFMQAYNQKLLGDGDQGILDSLRWDFDIPPARFADCTACLECEAKCTQHLPISQRMAEIAGLQPKANWK